MQPPLNRCFYNDNLRRLRAGITSLSHYREVVRPDQTDYSALLKSSKLDHFLTGIVARIAFS